MLRLNAAGIRATSARLEPPPPLPVRFPPDRCFDLAPIAALARAIRRRLPLAHHALELVTLGDLEEFLAVGEGPPRAAGRAHPNKARRGGTTTSRVAAPRCSRHRIDGAALAPHRWSY
jgi:hypothetical protein